MSVVSRIRQNARDAFTFGPKVWLRHLGRLREDALATVDVPRVGRVHIRAGDSDIAVLRQVFEDKEYALEWPQPLAIRIRAEYDRVLSTGGTPIIIDAGANIGAASIWFAKLFPQAVVVAVEPDPGNADMLRKNLGHIPGCVVIEAAIGAEPGYVNLTGHKHSWAIQTERSDSGTPIVTIDQAAAKAGPGELFIVKVDIEGFEKDLFASNTEWLARTFAIFIEPHDWMRPGEMTSGPFKKAMSNHPFEVFIRGENLLYVRA